MMNANTIAKTMQIRFSVASVVALGLSQSACGGGDGGVASTPAPPPVTYTKFADLTGKQVFQSASVAFTSRAGKDHQATFKAYGAGPTITREGGTYTVTLPDGAAATFTAADKDPDNTTATREA